MDVGPLNLVNFERAAEMLAAGSAVIPLSWRDRLHPDDRAWLAQVEAPLRALGREPPEPTLMEWCGNPALTVRQWR